MNKVLLFSAIIFIVSCSSKKDINVNASYELDLTQRDTIRFSSLFSDVYYLPLKSNIQGVYDMIDKMVISHDAIYMFDFFNTESLYVFNNDGSLKYQLSKKGNGPEEYNEVHDFNVDHDEGLIEIIDSRNAIVQYDLDGKFIQRVNIPIKAYKFQKISQFKYLLYDPQNFYTENDKCVFQLYSLENDKMICLECNLHFIPFFLESNIFSNNNEEIYFSRTFDNRIYKIDNKNIRSVFKLNFGKRGYSDEKLISLQNELEMMNYLNMNNKALHKPGLFVTDNWLITTYLDTKAGYVFFSRKDNVIVNGTNMVNDIDNGVSDIRIMGIYNNEVIGLINSIDFINASKIQGEAKVRYVKILNDINENSPPILVFLKLRN